MMLRRLMLRYDQKWASRLAISLTGRMSTCHSREWEGDMDVGVDVVGGKDNDDTTGCVR
jgi:hypothetical protein